MSNQPLIESSPLLQRLFVRMPPHAASIFTEQHLTLLHDALVANQPRKHKVDIRVSIPIIRMYLVILSGKERRSRARLRQERNLHLFWTASNILFLIAMIFCCTSVGIGIYMLLSQS